MRGVRLASFLMNAKAKRVDRGRDAVLVVNVVKDGEESPMRLFDNCTEELRKCGLNTFKQVHCMSIPLPGPTWGVGDALVYFANHVNNGRARLVIGGPGNHKDKGGQWKKLGSIAEQCLAKVKVPVVLVKGSSWGTDPAGDRNAFGRPMRTGADPNTGLNIYCCVDGTNTGDHAFDVAVSICREGDSLTGLHVETPTDEVAHANDIDLEGACDGSLACSTCHLILQQDVYDSLPPPEEEEEDMLDLAFDLTDTSRLGCQIKVDESLAGMVATVPGGTFDMSPPK